MDRYSRSYDDRYRGYYDRPRSDTYRPAENYRSERDYRDGGRNYSPNPHYSSSRSPGHNSSSGSRSDRYNYSDSRPYSSHYNSRGPSPSRSSSRSPRRPSYGYYRTNSSYPYSSRKSPSPVSGRSRSSSRRRESYDHRPYYGSPSYSQYPSSYRGSGGGGPYPPYSSRRHYSGPSSYSPNYPSGSYHSNNRESSTAPSPLHAHSQQPYAVPLQKSIQSTPSSTAPNSPRRQESTTSPVQQQLPKQQSLQKPQTDNATMATTTTATTTTAATTTTTASNTFTSSPTHTTISATETTVATTTSSSFNNSATQQAPPQHSQSTSSSYPPSSSSYPYSSSVSASPYTGSGSGPSALTRTHSGPPLHHHGSSNSSSNYHGSHYNTYHSAPAPVRQRVSWAPEQEKEVERYHTEQRKLCEEENKVLINCRKSRFELELADWEVKKLDHQLELVQKQWEENGMEELVKEEMTASKFAGNNMNTRLISTGTSKLMIL